jgi:hypothetical protein
VLGYPARFVVGSKWRSSGIGRVHLSVALIYGDAELFGRGFFVSTSAPGSAGARNESLLTYHSG